MAMPTAAIIGAGSSGITVARELKKRAYSFDCFEVSDNIGGNWYYKNPNGMSSCYQSLHIDTSKYVLAFDDFPLPEDSPDYLHHSDIFRYLNDYVGHHGLREHIRFNSEVVNAGPVGDGWRLTLNNGEQRQYDLLFVCSGHHWCPRWPTPEFEGTFEGVQIHSHDYLNPFEPHNLVGKNVLVVGMGNSAMDIASELGQRSITQNLYVAARRGAYIFPKYVMGKPADKFAALAPGWLPYKLQRFLMDVGSRFLVGDLEDFGLPKPDFKASQCHATVSGEFLLRAGSGDIKVKPNIKTLEGGRVRFMDETVEEVDAIIYATGYDVKFPFLSDDIVAVENNKLSLFKRIFLPQYPNLFFIGLAQVLPALLPFPREQMKLVIPYLEGKYALPEVSEMLVITALDEQRHSGHFYQSARHTMQVDAIKYAHEIKRELKQGYRRAARRGFKPPFNVAENKVMELA